MCGCGSGLRRGLGAKSHYASPALCVDNGAMVAYAGHQRLAAGQKRTLKHRRQGALARCPSSDSAAPANGDA